MFCADTTSAEYRRFMADYRSTGKELRRSPKGVIAAAIALVLVGGGVYVSLRVLRNMEPIEKPAQNSSEAELVIPDMTDTQEDENRIIYTYEAKFASDIHTGPLVLVNRSTPLPEDLEDGLANVYIEKSENLHVKDTEVNLQAEAMTALNAMADAFKAETGHSDLLVISGFRTREYQQGLYENELDETGANTSDLVAQAGYSEHETGYALDFSLYLDGGVVSSFDGEGDYAWILEHCAEYGFVLRYPADKVNVTEYSYESWHFRYVGVPHAVYMYQNGLCLEEYSTLLSQYSYEGEHLEITDADDMLYEVFTVTLTDTDSAAVAEIPIPAELPYTCSGNNRDGFIVTVETGRKAEREAETSAVTSDAAADESGSEAASE